MKFHCVAVAAPLNGSNLAGAQGRGCAIFRLRLRWQKQLPQTPLDTMQMAASCDFASKALPLVLQ
jgi:hypothetical protein